MSEPSENIDEIFEMIVLPSLDRITSCIAGLLPATLADRKELLLMSAVHFMGSLCGALDEEAGRPMTPEPSEESFKEALALLAELSGPSLQS